MAAIDDRHAVVTNELTHAALAESESPLAAVSMAGGLREELVKELAYERIDRVTGEVLERIASDPALAELSKEHSFAASLEEKAYLLKVAVHAGLPVPTGDVDWSGTRLEDATRPLLETAREINAERGFDTEEKIAEAYRIEDERIERQVGSLEKALLADSLSWKDLPPEASDAFYAFADGIRASMPSPMRNEDLVHFARYPFVLDALAAVHGERGFPFERPVLTVSPGESFIERRMRSAGEMIGREIDPESIRELGSGSEGMIYYARTSAGEELAIKLKNPEVAMVRDTVMVAGSLSLSRAVAEPLIPYAETREIAVSPYLPSAPTLEDLAVHLNDPAGGPAKDTVKQMVEAYSANHPEDSDLSGLKAMVSATVSELARARVPEPYTAKPINFLATGVSDGKLQITCVDPM